MFFHIFDAVVARARRLRTAKWVLLALLGVFFANQVLVQRALRMAVELSETSMAVHAELGGIECALASMSRWPNRDDPEVEREMSKLLDRQAHLEERLGAIVEERRLLQQQRFPLFAWWPWGETTDGATEP